MKGVVLLLLSAVFALAQINIAVAANMSFAMPKLIEAFHKYFPDQKVRFTIGSSGKLAAQILHGAKYDLFLSADSTYPKKLYVEGRAWSRPVVYALGELVVVSKEELQSLEDLAKLGRSAIANPRTAPYGQAAKEALQRSGLWETLQKKLVYGESIAQTVSYAIHGADAALIAKSALKAPNFPKLYTFEVDERLYEPIRQSMVIIEPKGASFFSFMLSRDAQKILKEYGYRTP